MGAFLLFLFARLSGSDRSQTRIEMFIESDRAQRPSTTIGFIPFVYPKCKSYRDVKFAVIAAPEHGQIFLSDDDEVLSTDAVDRPRPACDEKPVRGFEYLSQPGYSGDDGALLDQQSARRNLEIRIDNRGQVGADKKRSMTLRPVSP